MKNISFLLLLGFLLIAFVGCRNSEDRPRYRNQVEYPLFQGNSPFAFEGTFTVRELEDGTLTLDLRMNGPKGDATVAFPAHLHFGTYDRIDADIAFLLTPVNSETLRSETVLGPLSNGKILTFADFQNFDGHIKVHLADSGPEYEEILVAGNVGRNDASPEAFDATAITVCSPYY
ncbi:hypothetical protein A3SI_09802 [Nitritalea halalkaliphila LW7]|uniref:CHRD domain-containing protein n=1 Tax=Nitritalea halalkaliphila LW7 TaxID=1189621 RepID=I5C3T0_9BACT|nr:hypothetical protein [Nitritalea halalkaliphila]EIM76482.1 hypothetical protein A3SI_09802 [Nitritalea halalkaliphila LW7]